MNFNKKTFDIITINKENALLWGEQMWFILTNVFNNHKINKLQSHKLWIENITLAVIYQEFLASGLEAVNPKIDLIKLFDLPEFDWDEVALSFLASSEHLSYKYFEGYDINSRNTLLSDLVLKNKNFIFYSLVKHFGSTSNGVYDEMMKSVTGKDLLLKFDKYNAWDFVREEFTLFEDF